MTSPYHRLPLPDRFTMSDAQMLETADAVLARMRRRHSIREFSPRPIARAVVERCIAVAATAPSGANQQPWRFVLIGPGPLRYKLRRAAEAEEQAFYAGRAGAEWLEALSPIGTDPDKPFLETAPWLIAVFAQRHSENARGERIKHYYVTESVGIATGMLIAALHEAGLATLTHTPNPMGFLNETLGRPNYEKPFLLLVVGHPADDATVPAHAKRKLPLDTILSYR